MNQHDTPQATPIDRPVFVPPGGHKEVLLHSCCAPCSGEVMEAMPVSGIDYTIHFYNPSIHPLKEYMLCKEENMRFAGKFGIPFADKNDDYENDRKEWFAKAKGAEFESERGIRCTMCFDMRFEKAAQYAYESGFPVFVSSLGIPRWKNMVQVNDCGHRAAAPYDGVVYRDFNWHKDGGSVCMIEINKREHFYQQKYCGCVYSLRDSNAHRKLQGRIPIKPGVLYYGDESTQYENIQPNKIAVDKQNQIWLNHLLRHNLFINLIIPVQAGMMIDVGVLYRELN